MSEEGRVGDCWLAGTRLSRLQNITGNRREWEKLGFNFLYTPVMERVGFRPEIRPNRVKISSNGSKINQLTKNHFENFFTHLLHPIIAVARQPFWHPIQRSNVDDATPLHQPSAFATSGISKPRYKMEKNIDLTIFANLFTTNDMIKKNYPYDH
ncbi:hypothetical protein LXL04_031179 [Taraxacum kok-saghyz]